MNLHQRLAVLHTQVATQAGVKVDMYYKEGYGALFVSHGNRLAPHNVIAVIPDEMIKHGM